MTFVVPPGGGFYKAWIPPTEEQMRNWVEPEPTCDWYMASHGCDLAPGHEGDHWCDCGATWPQGHGFQ